MPTISIPKNYADTTDLTESQLDAAFRYIETALNTTKLASDNIQTDGIANGNLIASCVDGPKIASAAVSTAKLADAAITTVKVADGNITLAKLATALQGAFCPTGMVSPFAMTAVPSGWLACDGTPVSRATYATLYTTIGNTHGVGDGTTTFNLPDYRGRFLRGLDGSAVRDPDNATRTAMNTGGNTGNAIGSVQGDQVGPHTHAISTLSAAGASGTPAAGSGITSALASTNSNGTSESRPINAYVAYFIKT
jgi:microcystin-dependent protein